MCERGEKEQNEGENRKGRRRWRRKGKFEIIASALFQFFNVALNVGMTLPQKFGKKNLDTWTFVMICLIFRTLKQDFD
jgi:hypothetical protein